MLSLMKIRARSRWMYLTAVLVALYVGQTFPHEHCETGHADDFSHDHNAPVAHAHHSHPHADETTGHDDGAVPEHHHDLARHVDSYFVRTLSPIKSINPESTAQIAQLISGATDGLPGAAVDVYDDRTPDTIPVFPLDPRAPPTRC
jgi:hypothetical protein